MDSRLIALTAAITFRDAKVDRRPLGASQPTAINRARLTLLQIRTGPLVSSGTSITTAYKHA